MNNWLTFLFAFGFIFHEKLFAFEQIFEDSAYEYVTYDENPYLNASYDQDPYFDPPYNQVDQIQYVDSFYDQNPCLDSFEITPPSESHPLFVPPFVSFESYPQEIYQEEALPTLWGYNPPLLNEDCCGFSGFIECLLWKPDLRLNAFAKYDVALSDDLLADIKLNRLEFDWNFGFRIGTGYTPPFQPWEAQLIWTHYQSGYNDAVLNVGSTEETTAFSPQNGFENSLNSITMQNRAQIQFNVLDLILKRPYLTGKHLALTPFGGVRLLLDNNRYNFALDSTSFESPLNETFAYSNKFTGIGLTCGLDAFWNLFYSLKLQTSGALGLLCGNTHVTIRQPRFDNSTPITLTTDYRLQELTYTLDGGLYLVKSEKIYGGKGSVQIRLGWELHLISDQNRLFKNVFFYRSASPVSPGGYVKNDPLTFQGFVLGISASM